MSTSFSLSSRASNSSLTPTSRTRTYHPPSSSSAALPSTAVSNSASPTPAPAHTAPLTPPATHSDNQRAMMSSPSPSRFSKHTIAINDLIASSADGHTSILLDVLEFALYFDLTEMISSITRIIPPVALLDLVDN